MKLGVIVPQGWTGEYAGWDPQEAWRRTVAVACEAERLGVESVWAFDHFLTWPDPTDEIMFESFTTLTALAAITRRIRLGHLVICTGYRNPALTAKMVSTIDVISGGRMQLGIGAGWVEEEWRAFGYGFPPMPQRLARLRDDLGVITAMLAGDRHQHATFEGEHALVRDARNVPKPLQARMPIVVGGIGRPGTVSLAARFADEMNLDSLSPAEVAAVLPTIRAQCEAIGRDPASLAVSIHVWGEDIEVAGQQRVDRLAAYRELGMSRAIGLVRSTATDDEALPRLVEDALAAGIALD